MADSFQSSSSSSSSTPTVVNTPQSDWGLQLSKLLSIVAQGQYAWAMGQYDKGVAVSDQMIANFMQQSGQGAGLAQSLIQQYNDVYAPLAKQYIAQANSYNSEARQRFEMGRAESNVNQAMTAGQDEAERKLQSFGINPSDGRYQDLINTDRMKRAASMAGAGTQAALDTADRGRAMTEKGIQFGQNVPGMAVNALNTAIQAGSAAQNANLGQQNAGATLSQTAAPFYNASAAANKLPPVGQTSISGNQSSGRSSSPERDSSNQSNRGSGSGNGDSGSGRGGNGSQFGNGGPGAASSSVPRGGAAGGVGAIQPVAPYNDNSWSPIMGETESMGMAGIPGSGDSQGDDTQGWQENDWDTSGWGSDMGEGNGEDQDVSQGDGNWDDSSYGDWGQESLGDSSGGGSYEEEDYNSSQDNWGSYGDSSGGGSYDEEGYDEGGAVPMKASPSRGAQVDDVSARLNAGEYVIPRDVTQHRGPDYFKKLIAQSRRERTGAPGPRPGPKMRPALNRRPSFVSG